MGNTVQVASAEHFAFVHDEPLKLLTDSVQPGSKPKQIYNLNIRHHICKNGKEGVPTVHYASDRTMFPVQLERLNMGGLTRNSMILRDYRTQEILAVMVRQKHYGSTSTFGLLAFEPLFEGQQPSKMRYNDNTLYEWGKITRPIGVETRYDMVMAGNTSPIFHAYGSQDGGVRVVVGKKTCAQISPATKMVKSDWNIKVGPGIDPALMICFVGAVDEIHQMNLRQQACY